MTTRTIMPIRVIALSALTAALLLASPFTTPDAQAANPQAAARHSAQGGTAMQTKNYPKAVAEYVLAYAHDSIPDRLVNIAQAYAAMGNRSVAIELYQQVIAQAKRGPAADAAQRGLSALGGAAAPKAVASGKLSITTIPLGVEVFVDGQSRGKTPMAPVTLPAGNHSLELRIPSYKTVKQGVAIIAGQQKSLMEMMLIGVGVVDKGGAVSAGQPVATGSANAVMTINNVPPGGQVWLNGKPVTVRGTQARAKLKEPGLYKVEVRAAGRPNFTQDVVVQTGQNPVVSVNMGGAAAPPVQVGSPAPGAAYPSLAGSWFATELVKSGTRKTVHLTLQGSGNNITGKMVIKGFIGLQQRWKIDQCKSNEVTWEEEFQVSITRTSGGAKLLGNSGRLRSCSCDGRCPSSGSSTSMDMFVSPINAIMLTEDLVFQRKAGGPVPAQALRKLDINSLGGNWHIQMGSVEVNSQAKATLSSSGGRLTGTLTVERVSPIAGWKARQWCNRKSEVRATHLFRVSGTTSGDSLNMSFKHDKFTECSCAAAACLADAASVSVASQNFRLTLDGNHLVGPSMMLTRR